MGPTNRTFLRVFLLLGGLAFLGAGVLEGSMFLLALGFLAAGAGAFGLWYEMRDAGERA